MTTDTLRDLFTVQVQDMHSACVQSLGMTRRMADAATSDELRRALLDAVHGIERGRDTMAQLARNQGVDAKDRHCKAMEGMIAEADDDIFGTGYGDDDVRDAAIIATYQRMAHYAIAGYGTVRSFANRLDLKAEREAAQECLDKSYDGDRRFTEIATGEVNPAAV